VIVYNEQCNYIHN